MRVVQSWKLPVRSCTHMLRLWWRVCICLHRLYRVFSIDSTLLGGFYYHTCSGELPHWSLPTQSVPCRMQVVRLAHATDVRLHAYHSIRLLKLPNYQGGPRHSGIPTLVLRSIHALLAYGIQRWVSGCLLGNGLGQRWEANLVRHAVGCFLLRMPHHVNCALLRRSNQHFHAGHVPIGYRRLLLPTYRGDFLTIHFVGMYWILGQNSPHGWSNPWMLCEQWW